MNFDLTATPDALKESFFRLNSPQSIADLLELKNYSFLKYYLFVLPESERYSRFFIPKRNGEKRLIFEPVSNLKIIQKKLLQVLQLVYQPHPCVHGFVQNKSIVTNAEAHVKKKLVFNLDLKDFFPSIHFGRVRGMFMSYPYNLNDSVATILARICSLSYCLPQGAPTSPIISNMICAKLDSQLLKLAKHHGCFYTRYADDITFSISANKFPTSIVSLEHDGNKQKIEVGHAVKKIIEENGFVINFDKVRLQTRNKRQEVTGLVTNQKVNVERSYIRQIRAMLYAWEKFGYAAAEKEYLDKYCHKKSDKPYKQSAVFQHVMKGKIEFLGMVRGHEDTIFIKFNNQAARLERMGELTRCLFQLLEISNESDPEIISLIAQGETATVEFKEGACLNRIGKEDKKNMPEKILRAVASMMNSQPYGSLLIGVTDDGDILGIEREYGIADSGKNSWDGYHLFLSNVLDQSLSISNASQFYTISRHVINGKIVCLIKTRKAEEPVLAKNRLYVRTAAGTTELTQHKFTDFMKDWYRR